MKYFPIDTINESMTFPDFYELTERLVGEGKTTGGHKPPLYLEATQMNLVRMKRLKRKHRILSDVESALSLVDQPLLWVALVEAWCGDVGQSLPIIHQMAEWNPQIELKLVLRDEHLHIMDAFLTNGGRSIPKIIFIDPQNMEVLGDWGPRPAEVQKIVEQSIAERKALSTPEEKRAAYDAMQEVVQRWYAHDKTKGIQLEFMVALGHALGKYEMHPSSLS